MTLYRIHVRQFADRTRSWCVLRRYSEFDELHYALARAIGDALLPILEDCLDRGIPEVLRSACITDEGQLLPRYQFIQVSSTTKKQLKATSNAID